MRDGELFPPTFPPTAGPSPPPAVSVAPRPTGVRDEPIPQADLLAQGIARIDANDGGGEYTITELWWDPEAKEWTAAEGPPGIIEAEAFAYSLNPHGEADQMVRFWEVRALGGEVCRLIDVGGDSDGRQKVAAFCAHYAGYDETTGAFYSVTSCLNSLVQIALDVRLCSDNGSFGDHPGNTDAKLSGKAVGSYWGNTIATWSGSPDGQWIDLAYCARAADGSVIGSGTEAIDDVFIQARVTAAGILELRLVNNTTAISGVLCMIAGAVWVTPYGSPPGTIEFGNGDFHETLDIPEGDSVWGDGVWEPRA